MRSTVLSSTPNLDVLRAAILTVVLTSACAAPPLHEPVARRDSDGTEALPEISIAAPDAATDAGSTIESKAASDADDAQKQANNPLANMKALNFQNYAIREVSGIDDSANLFWVRYAQPFSTPNGNWLLRASLPLESVPVGGQQVESGVGDSNVFAAYLLDTVDPSMSFGVGPLLGIPTANEDALGTDQWSAGLAAVLFDGRSPVVQYGWLTTYAHKLAGSDRTADVNLLSVQPFGFLQLGSGAYLRSAGIWAFDFERGDYSVPIGMGLGKVVKFSKDIVFNFYLEPQFTVLEEGSGQPQFQLLFGFNTQYLGK